MSQNNLGNPGMIRATQFSTMDGPVGDPWIWAYPQHRKGILITTTLHLMLPNYDNI